MRIRDAKIIKGAGFDWKEGEEASKHVMHEDGSVNWKAAFSADPGVCRCPGCGEYYWWEGELLECLECGRQFVPGEKYKEDQDAESDGRDP